MYHVMSRGDQRLRITDIQLLTYNVRITWNTIGGLTKVVQAAATLAGTFSDISGLIGNCFFALPRVTSDARVSASHRFSI